VFQKGPFSRQFLCDKILFMRKPQTAVLIVTLIFTTLLSFNCVISPGRIFSPYSRCVSNAPQSSDLVGIWIPDKATIEDIRKVAEYGDKDLTSTKFVLGAGGDFEMVNLPDWWRSDFGEPQGFFDSEKGTWKLKASGSCYVIELALPSSRTSFNLLKTKTSENPKYAIEIGIGDPDAEHSMIFVKQ
jgi:hypothetical protein